MIEILRNTPSMEGNPPLTNAMQRRGNLTRIQHLLEIARLQQSKQRLRTLAGTRPGSDQNGISKKTRRPHEGTAPKKLVICGMAARSAPQFSQFELT